MKILFLVLSLPVLTIIKYFLFFFLSYIDDSLEFRSFDLYSVICFLIFYYFVFFYGKESKLLKFFKLKIKNMSDKRFSEVIFVIFFMIDSMLSPIHLIRFVILKRTKEMKLFCEMIIRQISFAPLS